MDLAPIYNYPIWAVGLVFIVILTTTLEFGFRVGLKKRETWKDADSGGGAVVLSSMFALMGLVLAFTYSIGVNHYDASKKAVIIEANELVRSFNADIETLDKMISRVVQLQSAVYRHREAMLATDEFDPTPADEELWEVADG